MSRTGRKEFLVERREEREKKKDTITGCEENAILTKVLFLQILSSYPVILSY